MNQPEMSKHWICQNQQFVKKAIMQTMEDFCGGNKTFNCEENNPFQLSNR